jgi:hypothetical protein
MKRSMPLDATLLFPSSIPLTQFIVYPLQPVYSIEPAAGTAGRALYFDGTSAFVSVSLQCSNPALSFRTCKPLSGFSSMTVGVWVYAMDVRNMTILDRSGNPGEQEYSMRLMFLGPQGCTASVWWV